MFEVTTTESIHRENYFPEIHKALRERLSSKFLFDLFFFCIFNFFQGQCFLDYHSDMLLPAGTFSNSVEVPNR